MKFFFLKIAKKKSSSSNKRRAFLIRSVVALPMLSLLLNSKESEAGEKTASPPPTTLPPTPSPPTDTTPSSAGFIQSIFNKLAAADGAQYVGRCPDLETLRQTVPSHEGQKIVLSGRESAPPGQKSVGGGELFASRNSELKDDDGIVFRVNADWCWQRQVQHNIDAQWFGVYNDGRVCGDAFSRALDFVVAQGGTLLLPLGIINLGTLRKTIKWFDGIKKFAIRGQGKNTVLTFDNIDPPIRSNKKNWVSEPFLFTFRGANANQYIDSLVLENFCIDYARQRNQGGTSLEALGECHPTPHSTGTIALYLNYCLNPIIRNVSFSNIYGSGVYCRRNYYPLCENLSFYNVSANQIVARDNRMDRDNSGGAIFYWSCFGGLIHGCIAWNTRKYTVDFLSPDNKQQINGTLCGYIGFWSEYGFQSKTRDNEGPPLIDWATHINQDADTASRSIQISNCIVSGYVIGIKGETQTDISVLNNIVLNCYLPITCSGVRGVVQRNYTNMLHCEDIKCPQGGLEFKRSHLGGMTYAKEGNANLNLEISNNYVRTRKYPPITVDRLNLKFLYNYIEMDGVANIFKSTGQGRNFGLEIRGNIYYFGKDSLPKISDLAHNADACIAGNTFIINTSKPPVLRFLDTQDAQCINFIDNTVMGPITILSNIRSNVTGNYFSVRQPVQTFLLLNAANGRVENNTFEVPRGFAKAAVTVKGDQWRIKNNIFKITMTSHSIGKARSFIAVRKDSSFIHITDNSLIDNVDDVALLSAEVCGVVSLCDNVSDGQAPLVATLSPLKGPVTLRGNSFAGGISRAKLGEEPNRAANLAPQFKPLPGERLYYLLPDAGGKEGIVMTTQGWREFGAISPDA